MRFITIKTRVTIYFTLMMVLVVALVLVFMLIVGQRVLTNNAEATLLDVVHDNIDDVEYKDGYLDLDELNLYRHNVYILVYDDAQQLIGGAGLRHFDGDDEFFNGETRDVVIDGENYLVYDLYVQNPGGNVWLRGITSTDNSFSAVRIIVILSLVLFPVLVLLTAVVGWLIARRAFLPVRQITDTVDAISDYLFTAGMVANRNLNQEGMIPDYIHYVGNILIDTIRFNRHRLVQPMWFSSLGLRKGNYLLLTLNRRDLLEKKAVLHSLLQTVIEKAGGMPIVAPLHPYVQKAVKSLEVNAPNLHILPPQSYLHFGFLINQARGIVTDSGNIAEEATFLDVPCITLNTYAEHPETWRIGTNELVGENSFALSASLDKLLYGEWKHTTLPDRWDGRTAERIVQTLLNGNNS